MRISSLPRKALYGVVGALVVLLSSLTVAQPPTRLKLTFFAVDLNSNGGKGTNPDMKLADYLASHAPVKISGEDARTYEKMIRKLVDRNPNDGPYLARVTPYVVVAASMLGADFEVLAAYENPAGGRTYHSYLVINRQTFPAQPKLEQVIQYLRDRETPAKFIFHDKFSTSSYFLPTLYFRKNDIYSMPNSINSLRAIISEDINKNIVDGQAPIGSSKLVEMVANQQADVAAVWDVTKNDSAFADKVYFIQLPDDLPNDLLVCSSNLEAKTKDELRKAINDMKPDQINEGDFKTWIDIEKARDARQALSDLRHLADPRSTAATIKIESSLAPKDAPLLDSIKQAIRLSNTEFIPWDEDYHANADVDWFVESIHDDAIRLTSKVNYSNLEPQVFEISFIGSEDLSKRVASIIQSRMHRIRYVWPYEDHSPTVIRDVEFPVSSDSVFKVVKIVWKNPMRNDFYDGEQFDATVSNANKFGFQLEGAGFPNKFDPLSNVSYRVILVRPTHESRVFTILTYVFVGLLVLAAIGAALDMRRRARKPKEAPLLTGETFNQRCRKLADSYRSFWLNRGLVEADVLWCDRTSLEELISDLKAIGADPDFDVVKRKTRGWALLANIPVLSKVLGLSLDRSVREEQVFDASKVGNYFRLGKTIKFLIKANALSPFTGEKLEWDALNQLARETFKPISPEISNNGNGDELFRSEHPILLSLIAKHFNGVIQESKEKVCFFNKKWEVTVNGTERVLACTAVLPSALELNGGSATVQKLTLRAEVPLNAELCASSECNEVNAWLLGKIHRVEFSKNGDRTLFLSFRPTALVKIDD